MVLPNEPLGPTVTFAAYGFGAAFAVANAFDVIGLPLTKIALPIVDFAAAPTAGDNLAAAPAALPRHAYRRLRLPTWALWPAPGRAGVGRWRVAGDALRTVGAALPRSRQPNGQPERARQARTATHLLECVRHASGLRPNSGSKSCR